MSKPKVVHVYREYVADGWRLAFGRPPEDMPKSVTQHQEYLGEYVPADETLSPAIVDAVKAYQAVCLDVCDDNSPRWHEGYELRRAIDRAIEADAKEREG